MKVRTHKLLAMAIALAPSFPAFAQDNSPALEEILVTAQKRVQNLRDVPVSVNALSSDKLESSGITSIERVADYIPSFNMTQTGIGTNIAIRGISSGVNQGFEQSAAQFVDGIHYGRAQLSRAPFLDLERVEILRGPQSILFGKNSTAGAISITTAKPGDELEAKLTALYEPEHGEQDVRLVLSGPITDTLGGRLAILESSIDGFMENTTLQRDESGDKNRVVRATLQWKPNDAWDITLKAEDGSFDSDGRNVEVVNAVYNPNPVYDRAGKLVTPVAYRNVLSALTKANYLLDTTHDWKRQSNGDYSYNDTENVTLTIERDFGEHTLTSVTGYNAYNYEELCDCDFTGAPGFNILSDEDYSQVSQELRLASDEDRTVSYLGGLFFQSSSLDFHDSIRVPSDSFVAQAFTPLLGASLANLLRNASTERNFEQDTDLAAVFAQATWNITDVSRLILGARYTAEQKDGSRTQYHISNTGVTLPQGAPTDLYNFIWSQFKIDPHSINGDRDESALTPSITFQQDINSTDMLYASFTTGFKSGGFDVRANAAPDELGGIFQGQTIPANALFPTGKVPDIKGTWEFEEEKVRNFEVGGKFLFADGGAELNVAIFRSEFENMQTSQFDGSLSFNVTNAGEAVVQGLEVDGRWAATDSVLVRGGFAYIDFEYTDFKNSQCYFGQPDPEGDAICDATGKRREFTPELQGNVGADYTINFDNGLKLVSTLDVIYSDDYLTTPSLDPKFEQEAYTKLNARIALSGNGDKWELALIGKNLTDESIVSYANGLPVATTLTSGTSSGYYAFYERPRSVAVQGTIKF